MMVGKRIKERRKEIGMSADKLAEALGKDRSAKTDKFEHFYNQELLWACNRNTG